jgi:hypothetical protein
MGGAQEHGDKQKGVPTGTDTHGGTAAGVRGSSSILKQMVRNVVGTGVTLPQTVNFDDNTLQLLDSRQKVFTNAQLVKLAKTLKLDTSPPTTTAQNTQEATTRAEQQPVPSGQEIFGAE